jgi:hypothetical protein
MTIKMRWLDWVVRESAAPLPDMPWSRTVRAGGERRTATAEPAADTSPPLRAACG